MKRIEVVAAVLGGLGVCVELLLLKRVLAGPPIDSASVALMYKRPHARALQHPTEAQ